MLPIPIKPIVMRSLGAGMGPRPMAEAGIMVGRAAAAAIRFMKERREIMVPWSGCVSEP